MDYTDIKDFVVNFSKKPVRFEELYPVEFDAIQSFTNFLPPKTPIKQRFWHITHDMFEYPKCAVCNGVVTSWKKDTLEYSLYCSAKCRNSHEISIDKRKQTMIQRYGVDSFAKTDEYKQHMKSLPRWSMSEEQKQQLSTAAKVRWNGVSDDKRTEWALTKKQQFKKKFGVTSYSQTTTGKKLLRDTMQQKYGTDTIKQSLIPPETRAKLYDIDWLTHHHHTLKLTQQQIAALLNVDPTTIGRVLDAFGISKHRYYGSAGQRELANWIKALGHEVLENYKIPNTNYELDVFVPAHNVAIEYCGVYWHCDLHPRITSDYHANKLKMCQEHGIRLFTIFDIEWNNKQDIIKALVLSSIGHRCGQIVGARQCSIVDVDPKTKTTFMNKHHIQGADKSSYAKGLLFHDKIVAILSYTLKKKIIEITRYATDISLSIPGGFTKLLQHVNKIHTPDKIITFADLRVSEGKMYDLCGFVCDKVIPPSFSIIDNKRKIMLHRSNFMKHKIIERHPELREYKTEREMHYVMGLLRVWDCGKRRYVWNRSN